VVPNDAQLLKTVEQLIEQQNVAVVVIGHSVKNNADPNVVQSHIEAFVTDLTLACGVPIHLEPEQYTTQAALRIQGRNAQTDASAAALILDSFLARSNKTSAVDFEQ
jgi:RNase H-fold protein (predicted Holliday junction resolvase)